MASRYGCLEPARRDAGGSFRLLVIAVVVYGVDIPGFRFVLVITVVLLTGMFAANLLGLIMLEHWGAHPQGRIPLVRSIYNSVQQVSGTVLAPNGPAIRQAVLTIQYPRAGSW